MSLWAREHVTKAESGKRKADASLGRFPLSAFRFPLSRLIFAAIICLLPAGCAQESAVSERIPLDVFADDLFANDPNARQVLVPGDQAWTETGIQVHTGKPVTVSAQGKLEFHKPSRSNRGHPSQCGPEGSYFFDDRAANKEFPIPSAAAGPAACYSLIGRIGDGEPFYIGSKKSWIVRETGLLQLGINDFDVSDNSGEFFVQIEQPQTVQPIAYEEAIPWDAAPGKPQENSSVVVFYIDGLRPDVVREMAAMGHLPNINKMFVEGGVWLSKSFTAFPSDTITSNGTMWTGCFSDRHGLKGQVRFSRRTLHSESYLEPLGPNRSSRLLAPQGIDKLLHRAETASVRAIRGEEVGNRWRQSRTTDVPPLYVYLRENGSDWSTGVLPLMTDVPPLLWTRSMVRHMPYLQSQNAWQYIDDANTHYARNYLLGQVSPVTIIWLPETDSVSHKQSRGQFGMTRRTIARADLLIGEVVSDLSRQGRLQNTYFMLISDHGHHGGRKTHLSHFDIADELFFKPREISPAGNWVGGGLGLSVRQHRIWNRHKEDNSREFLFIDGDSDGVARIFLPRGHFRSRDWTGAGRPGDLLAYRIAEHLPAVNLVETLAATKAVHGNGSVQRPIDLILMKLTEESLLITTARRGQAVIDRKRDQAGRWLYRYRPVENVLPTEDGQVVYEAVVRPSADPLGLLEHFSANELKKYHDERTWLRMTAGTFYPDSVVSMSRHMLWDDTLDHREREFAPDLVVTARPNWYFGTGASPGTMHGYPLADSMRSTWFITGPNIRRGTRLDDPCRMVDLTPTILKMVGVDYNSDQFDGRALDGIYESESQDEVIAAHPVYWSEFDLDAWSELEYEGLAAYEDLPFSINRPGSAFDLNNIAYNALTIGDLSVFRLFDDVLSPLWNGRRRITEAVEGADRLVRNDERRWIGEGVETVNVPGIVLADYSITSLGNLKRADKAVDWIQQRGRDADQSLAQRMGRSRLPGSSAVNKTIDGLQYGLWEAYRFAQRIVVHVLDETILNGIENSTDRAVNSFRRLPAEVKVDDAPR